MQRLADTDNTEIRKKYGIRILLRFRVFFADKVCYLLDGVIMQRLADTDNTKIREYRKNTEQSENAEQTQKYERNQYGTYFVHS